MEAMGIKGDIQHFPARNEVVHAYSDHSKAKKYFKINNDKFTPLNEGVAKMASWAKKVGARSSNTFSNIEITEKLPLSWV